MHADTKRLVALNVVGGVAVLGSYAWLLATRGDASTALWGGVPAAWQPLYNVSMLTATAGYFAFAQHLFFRLDPRTARFAGRPYRALEAVFTLILLPSAAWMPLTFAYVDEPSPALWLAVRAVLSVVGLASVALLVGLVRSEPKLPRASWLVAVVGCALFCFQTAVLDALVWTHYFNAVPS